MRHLNLAPLIFALLLVALGFLIMLHQFLIWRVWFQPEDLHHETFVLASFAAAVGILIGTNLGEEPREQHQTTVSTASDPDSAHESR